MSHAATTWQSSDARKDCVLPGPCQPMPITPRLIRLLAEAPELCLAKAGSTAGRIAADPAAFRKLRRLSVRDRRASWERDCSDMFHLNITFHHGAATAHRSVREKSGQSRCGGRMANLQARAYAGRIL